jgi:hypothetical protein
MTEPVPEDSLLKIGRILQLQKKHDQSLEKYIEVCTSLSSKIRSDPDKIADYPLIVLALTYAVEIYKLHHDPEKALLLLNVERQILELMESHQNSVLPKTELLPILDEMSASFSRVTNRQQIVDNFVQAKLTADAEKATEQRAKIIKAGEEVRELYKHSWWARFGEWVEEHPVWIMLISLAVMAVILVAVLLWFRAIPRRKQRFQLPEHNLGRHHGPHPPHGPRDDML